MGDRTTTALFQNSHPMSVLKSVPYCLKIPLPLGLHYPHKQNNDRMGGKEYRGLPWGLLQSVLPHCFNLSRHVTLTSLSLACPSALLQCQSSCHTDITLRHIPPHCSSVSHHATLTSLSSACFTTLLLFSRRVTQTSFFSLFHRTASVSVVMSHRHLSSASLCQSDWHLSQKPACSDWIRGRHKLKLWTVCLTLSSFSARQNIPSGLATNWFFHGDWIPPTVHCTGEKKLKKKKKTPKKPHHHLAVHSGSSSHSTKNADKFPTEIVVHTPMRAQTAMAMWKWLVSVRL